METLLNSPQVDRVESQLLLHPSGRHAGLFRQTGFEIFRRLFMVQQLEGLCDRPAFNLPPEPGAARLARRRPELRRPAHQRWPISDHPDALINDQYRSVHGSQRFLHNIVRYSGCGAFSAQCSHVRGARHAASWWPWCWAPASARRAATSPSSASIPEYRRQGLARMLLSLAAFHFLRLGAVEISLTVTEANAEAIELYRAEGYACEHTFDAAVWQRELNV